MNGYNGWSNRQTWAANLWLSNDEPAYRAGIAALEGASDPVEAGKRLRRVWWTRLPAHARDEAFPPTEINWREIGEAWLDDMEPAPLTARVCNGHRPNEACQ